MSATDLGATAATVPPAEVRTGLQRLPSPGRMLEEIFLNAPVGLQIYARNGQCVLVNPMHTRLFGAVPPPDYNIFEDTILQERGLVGLVRRAFAGERISIPPLWYDVRDLRNVHVQGQGRRFAVGAEMVPLRTEGEGDVSHVLVVFHDVSDTHRAREEAEAARAAAEATAARRPCSPTPGACCCRRWTTRTRWPGWRVLPRRRWPTSAWSTWSTSRAMCAAWPPGMPTRRRSR